MTDDLDMELAEQAESPLVAVVRHRPGSPVVGCAWCVRFAAMDSAFRGGEVAVMEDTVEPSLWDDAA